MTNLLGTNEAAKYLGVSRQTMRNWKNAKQGPVYIFCGGRRMYRKKDLDRFMTQGNV